MVCKEIHVRSFRSLHRVQNEAKWGEEREKQVVGGVEEESGGWLTCPIGNVTPPPGSGPWCLVCEASTNYELRMPHGNWL